MMKEIWGSREGLCKGKGGSMHIADVDQGMLGANGIVGGGAPIAVGAALAAKLDGEGKVAIAFSGDGACNQGTTFEAMSACRRSKSSAVIMIFRRFNMASSPSSIESRGARCVQVMQRKT